MNVLFICRGNVGRSQAAMEYFKKFSTASDQTDSAGTHAADTTITLGELPMSGGMIGALKEEGIDISSHHAKQLTETMLNDFDKIINMAAPEYTPDWLSSHTNYEFWEIPDAKYLPINEARVIRDHIKAHVKRLISREI